MVFYSQGIGNYFKIQLIMRLLHSLRSVEVREEERKRRFLTSIMSNGSGHNERSELMAALNRGFARMRRSRIRKLPSSVVETSQIRLLDRVSTGKRREVYRTMGYLWIEFFLFMYFRK